MGYVYEGFVPMHHFLGENRATDDGTEGGMMVFWWSLVKKM